MFYSNGVDKSIRNDRTNGYLDYGLPEFTVLDVADERLTREFARISKSRRKGFVIRYVGSYGTKMVRDIYWLQTRRRASQSGNGIRFDHDVKPTSCNPSRQPKRSGCKRLELDQIIADGKAYQIAETAKFHFLHYVVAMAFDRACGYADQRGGFLIAFPACQQLHYF
jgi:hypothetical protein